MNLYNLCFMMNVNVTFPVTWPFTVHRVNSNLKLSINSHILHVCPCVCVCATVISEISRMEGCSTTLLSPTWRGSPDKLHQLVFKSTQHVVQEKKIAFGIFHTYCMKPHLACYISAILKKMVISLRKVKLFHLHAAGMHAARKKNKL